MNHRSTTSSAWPSRVARYFTGPRSASTVLAFTLDGGLLDLQVGEGHRLDRKLAGKAVALALPSFVARGAKL
jgi:hypothetical protein